MAVPSLLDVPEAPAPAAPAEEAPAAPESADAAPVAPAEDAPAPRASLLQALAAGQPVEAAPEAPAAPERVVKRDGRHEIWADGEGTVTVLVTADLFKATINGVPVDAELIHRCCYRQVMSKLSELASPVKPNFTWDLLTVSEAVAERGIRFDALTKEF